MRAPLALLIFLGTSNAWAEEPMNYVIVPKVAAGIASDAVKAAQAPSPELDDLQGRLRSTNAWAAKLAEADRIAHDQGLAEARRMTIGWGAQAVAVEFNHPKPITPCKPVIMASSEAKVDLLAQLAAPQTVACH